MDIFEKALEEIAKEFPVRRMNSKYAQIELDELFDWYNYIFIGVFLNGDKVILTDMAEYAPLCNWEDENIPEVEAICKKHGLIFNNYNIECDYHSNEDVKRYLECLLEFSEKYADK